MAEMERTVRFPRAPGLLLGARGVRGDEDMGGYLLIVSRDRPDLYEYLKRQFSEVENFEVLLARRLGERRQRAETHEPERRRAERRRRPESYHRSDWFMIAPQEASRT